MILYRTLRGVTLALRAVQMAALRVTFVVSDAAHTTGSGAKAAALASLSKREEDAYQELVAAKRRTEQQMEILLAREDAATDNFQDVCYENSSLRHNILNEVL
jgi:hypothetical protein